MASIPAPEELAERLLSMADDPELSFEEFAAAIRTDRAAVRREVLLEAAAVARQYGSGEARDIAVDIRALAESKEPGR